MTNKEFFDLYAKPGTIGLVGGTALIDRGIRKAQKILTSDKKESLWSHAFIVSGQREDNFIWIIESDLEFHSKQIKLGVQENRISKYDSETEFPNVAILDFNLSNTDSNAIIGEALNLVALKTQYSIREVFGVLYSVLNQQSRQKENIFKQQNSLFCSAFVQKCYEAIGLKFNKDISASQLAPNDIYITGLPKQIHEIIRTI